jgi:hypothetical protein
VPINLITRTEMVIGNASVVREKNAHLRNLSVKENGAEVRLSFSPGDDLPPGEHSQAWITFKDNFGDLQHFANLDVNPGGAGLVVGWTLLAPAALLRIVVFAAY